MKLPKAETLTPGVLCRTRRQGSYVITSNEIRSRFTLWKESGGKYEKVTTGKSPLVLYEKIPWV